MHTMRQPLFDPSCAFQTNVSGEDIAMWERQGRFDILQWILFYKKNYANQLNLYIINHLAQ